eukprot:219203_1
MRAFFKSDKIRLMGTLSESRPSINWALIGDRWLPAAEGSSRRSTFGVSSPYSGKEIARLQSADKSDAVDAVEMASSKLSSWWKLGYSARQDILRRWEALIQENREDLSVLISSESGKPLIESRGEIAYAASYISLYADMASNSAGGEVLPSRSSQRGFTIRRPMGVCAMITPFNFPAAMIARKVAPALAVGCTCVVKPAEATPLTALALHELGLQAGIPEGVLSVLPSSRDDSISIGKELCTNPQVAKISFTGSTGVGKELLKLAACTVKRATLELGGNAPFLVFADADLDAAAQGLLLAKFRFAGQTCVCANRCIVEESIADTFIQKVTQLLDSYRLGDPLQSETQMGPLININAVERMRRMVKNAEDLGASLVYGGEGISAQHDLGELFVSPAILKGCNMDMECCDDEIFGPILPVMTFNGEEEAVSIANGVKQGGLAGYVFTSSISRAMRVSESLEVGMVGINDAAISSAHIPFGGIGEAGIGREGGRYGLDEYMEIQYLCLSI